MRRIKLTETQKSKLTQAVNVEKAMTEQFRTAQIQVNSANRHRVDLYEMILEAHNVDPKSLLLNGRFTIRTDGYLELEEVKASARIKKQVNTKVKR